MFCKPNFLFAFVSLLCLFLISNRLFQMLCTKSILSNLGTLIVKCRRSFFFIKSKPQFLTLNITDSQDR